MLPVTNRNVTQPRLRSSLLVLFLTVMLPVFVGGACGKNSGSSSQSSDQETGGESSLDRELSRLIGSLEFVREEYKDAVKDGKITDETEYREAHQMGIKGAVARFEKIRRKMAARDSQQTEKVETNLNELSTLIENKGSVSKEEALVDSTIKLLEQLRTSSGDPTLAAYRKQVADVDALLHAERQSNGYRIGVFASEPRKHFTPDGTPVDRPADATYLGVTLREKRTKRYLPGSTVKIKHGDRTFTLSETWGKFHHYGTHVSGPFDPETPIEVSVSPPAYGRHAEMKGSYLESASVTFPVKSAQSGGHPMFSGPDPGPLSSDYKLGSSLQIALSEPMEIKTVGPYRVGFIVEGSEPFWTWSDGELQTHAGKESNQNHLEIVLLDKRTNEPLPHASISLQLSGGDTEKTIDLYPLLAEFYHYGTNAAVPPGVTYNVRANISPPDLHTFKKERFSRETVTFEWTKSE